jgi:hypothetical protein
VLIILEAKLGRYTFKESDSRRLIWVQSWVYWMLAGYPPSKLLLEKPRSPAPASPRLDAETVRPVKFPVIALRERTGTNPSDFELACGLSSGESEDLRYHRASDFPSYPTRVVHPGRVYGAISYPRWKSADVEDIGGLNSPLSPRVHRLRELKKCQTIP